MTARETRGETGHRPSAPQRSAWKGLQEEEVWAEVPSKGEERSAGLVLGTQMSDRGLFTEEWGRRWQNDLWRAIMCQGSNLLKYEEVTF